MEDQKSLRESVKEIFILLKRNIFHIGYFLVTGLVIGAIYANWVMETTYSSTGSLEIRQTANEAQLIQITNAMTSGEFIDEVVLKLGEEGYAMLPDGNPLTATFIETGLKTSYTVNNPIITVTFESEYQALTLLSLNTIIDEFVVYGNENLSVVNNNLYVYENAEVAVKTGLSNTMIYGLSIVLGLLFGVAVVLITDYSSGQILFVSDLDQFGFRTYQLTKIKTKTRDELERVKQLNQNILTMQNYMESKIENRFLKTIAVSSFKKSKHVDQLIEAIAKTYAQNDQKTLIVDLDFVKADLNEYFEVDAKENIVDIAEQNLDHFVFKKLQNDLYFLPAKEVTYPSKFYKSEAFRSAVERVSKDFDVVIFRLSQVEDDMTSLNALSLFDFLVTNVVINKTSKKKLKEYMSVINHHQYQNVVINAFDK